jgi:hypothetical protein
MVSKRNAALEALGAPPKPAETVVVPAEPEAAPVPAKPAKVQAKVMVYMHPKVARKFKEIAFVEDRKANDVYLDAIDLYLTQQGHGGIKGVTGR